MDFKDYLDKNKRWYIFKPGAGDLGYNVPYTYRLLSQAVNANADSISFTFSNCVWSRDRQMLGQAQLLLDATKILKVLEIILEKDEAVKEHLILVSDTPDTLTFRIV